MTIDVLDELAAIGVEVTPQGENLVIRPASRVSPELKKRLKARKSEVLALLRARGTTEAAKDISCRYDWKPGYHGLRLRCVAHHHAAETPTVFVMRWAGRDTLHKMADLGILTGQALADSKRVN